MNNGVKKCLIKLCCLLLFIFVFQTEFAYAVKIVAVVNDDVVTDVDVNDFESSLCKLDKRFKCGSQNSRQMALISLVESVLKMEHFKQMQIINDKQLNSGYSEYRNSVLKSLNIPAGNISKSFEDYLHTEYLWNVMTASQAQQTDITDDDVEKFISKQGNIVKNKSKDQIKQLILQEKVNDISQSTMSELKKFYLVDIKGL